jgi:hypothetical protein
VYKNIHFKILMSEMNKSRKKEKKKKKNYWLQASEALLQSLVTNVIRAIPFLILVRGVHSNCYNNCENNGNGRRIKLRGTHDLHKLWNTWDKGVFSWICYEIVKH